MAFDALVVDLDGTIWDSWPFYAKLLAEGDAPLEADLLVRLQSGANLVNLIPDSPCRSRRHFEQMCRERASELELYPTVEETLSVAVSAGIHLGVATSLPGWVCEPMLEATDLADLFTFIGHASSCPGRKPSRRFVEAVLEAMGAAAENARYVGDTLLDARTARAAGLPFYWAGYGYERPEPDFANAVLSTFSEVLE